MKKLFTNKVFLHILFITIVLAALLRVWRLDKIPISMSDDETRVVYSAYSIWQTGRDITGRFLPVQFPLSGYTFNPVPIYLTSPFVGLLGLTMFSARLPFALAGVLTVLLVYFISSLLSKDKRIGLLSAGVMTFSVWHLQISRFAYEGVIGLFFYTLGVYFFLRVKKNSFWLLMASLASFFAGFYSYSGFKFILVPILAVLFWYRVKELSRKQILVAVSFLFLNYLSFYYLAKTQGALTYGGSLFFFKDVKSVATDVELERRASGAPEILRTLYHNKFTVLWKEFFSQYQYAFSPQYLFSAQESSGIFSLWFRGQLYYHESILLLLGMLYLFVKRKKELLLMLSFLLIGALPAGLGPQPITYTIRSSFMLPWLSILAASGIFGLSTFVKSKKRIWLVYGIIGIVYLYAIGGYLTQYYFEWTIYGAKYYSKSDQDLALFLLQKKDSKQPIVTYDVQPITFLHYALYAKLPSQKVQEVFGQNPIHIDGLTFMSDCPNFGKLDLGSMGPLHSLAIFSASCIERQKAPLQYKPTTILKSLEGSNEWYVFNL